MQKIISLAVALGTGVALTQSAHAIDRTWYLGMGAGVSHLTPDTKGSDFTLEDDSSVATGLYLGMDVNQWLSAELAYTRLGEATLSGGESIEYNSLSFGGVAYLLGHREAQNRQDGWSAYARFGLNKMDNSASISLDESDSTALWLGAGLQWPIGRQWGLRAELVSFDGDAQSAMASVYWRTDTNDVLAGKQQRSAVKASIGEPSTQQPEGPTLISDRSTQTPERPTPISDLAAQTPEPTLPISDRSTTMPERTAAKSCAVPPAVGEPTDADGCGLFSGIVQGVDFVVGTSRLTATANRVLDELAQSLNRFPDLVVELQVHTEEFAEPGSAMQLSRERVVAVARYLAGKAVDVSRLRARAFGARQPLFDNGSVNDQQKNSRVVLRVL